MICEITELNDKNCIIKETLKKIFPKKFLLSILDKQSVLVQFLVSHTIYSARIFIKTQISKEFLLI